MCLRNMREDVANLTVYIALVLFFLLTNLNAQQLLGLSYVVSAPRGDTRAFIENTSYAGFGIEGRQFVNDHFAVGMTFGWSKFQQQVQSIDGNTVTIEDHLLDSFPLLFNGSYFLFKETSEFRPYAALNSGVYFINARTTDPKDFKIFQDKSLYFGISPEIGMLAEMFNDLNLLLFLRYNYNIKFSGPGKYPYLSIHLTLVSVSIL